MTEIAHAAIDAGADIVVGHGPHYSLPVEVYRGKPIFYGLGSFSFHTGHGGRRHGDWIGMMARIEAGPAGIDGGALPLRAAQRGQRDRALRAGGGGRHVRPPRRTRRPPRYEAYPGGRLGPDRAVTADRASDLFGKFGRSHCPYRHPGEGRRSTGHAALCAGMMGPGLRRDDDLADQLTTGIRSPRLSSAPRHRLRSSRASRRKHPLCARQAAGPGRSSAACRRSAPGRSASAIRRSGAAASG